MALGALGFAHVFAGWWAAQQDLAEIPFGHIEGVGLSDPTKLVDLHGWTERGMVHAYLALGFVCLAAMTIVWTLGRQPAEAPGGGLAALKGLDD
jgi:hypothetical protein